MKLTFPLARLAAVAAATVFIFCADALAQTPIVIKFSHVVSNDTTKGKGALKFKELAEARTNGKVKVEVYPNSSLYKDKEEIEALQIGAVQMLAPAVSKFGPLGLREFEAFDLPYLFDSAAELDRVTQGPIGIGLLKKLETKGIVGLAYWDNGFRNMTANSSNGSTCSFRISCAPHSQALANRNRSKPISQAIGRAGSTMNTGWSTTRPQPK